MGSYESCFDGRGDRKLSGYHLARGPRQRQGGHNARRIGSSFAVTWLAMAVKCHTRIEGPARQDPRRADCAERRRCPFVAPKSMLPAAPVANSRCTTRTGDRSNLPALTSWRALLDTIGLDLPSTVPTTNFCLSRLHSRPSNVIAARARISADAATTTSGGGRPP